MTEGTLQYAYHCTQVVTANYAPARVIHDRFVAVEKPTRWSQLDQTQSPKSTVSFFVKLDAEFIVVSNSIIFANNTKKEL